MPHGRVDSSQTEHDLRELMHGGLKKQEGHYVRPNKNIPVFRVTRPYLNLLVKPRIFSGFSGKNIILCILKGEMPFKMHKIIYFSPKTKYLKKWYVPTLCKIFRPVT